MICPFCGTEMEKGILSGDGRSKVRWKAGDKKADIWDALSCLGSVSAVKYTLTAFTVEAFFCFACKKMIIETDVDK
jgi:hypothetical protein